MPNASSGRVFGSAPAGKRSLHTSGIARSSATGSPSLSAPIEPYLNCSTAGVRIGVLNESALPSSMLPQLSSSATAAAAGSQVSANAVPTSSP